MTSAVMCRPERWNVGRFSCGDLDDQPDHIRTLFSRAMSEMYRLEVPQYGTLMELVADVNAQVLDRKPDPSLQAHLKRDGRAMSASDFERHGAIRLGTPRELAFTMPACLRRHGHVSPSGYYDLVCRWCSRPFDRLPPDRRRAPSVQNPFRVFTSLLRLELIDDPKLRDEAAAILAGRRIFTPRADRACRGLRSVKVA